MLSHRLALFGIFYVSLILLGLALQQTLSIGDSPVKKWPLSHCKRLPFVAIPSVASVMQFASVPCFLQTSSAFWDETDALGESRETPHV
jgi:hypothetical protein